MKKIFVSIVATLAFGLSAFAVNPDYVDYCQLDSMSREDFEDMFDSWEDSDVQELFEDAPIVEFKKLEESDVDSEILEMWNVVNSQIPDVSRDDVYISMAFNDFDDGIWDGWFIISQFNSKDDASCYAYYFAVDFGDDSTASYGEHLYASDSGADIDENLANVQKIGNSDRDEFVLEIEQSDVTALMSQAIAAQGFKIDQFAEIPPETMDEEDWGVIDYVEKRILEDADPGDMYVSMVFRTIHGEFQAGRMGWYAPLSGWGRHTDIPVLFFVRALIWFRGGADEEDCKIFCCAGFDCLRIFSGICRYGIRR